MKKHMKLAIATCLGLMAAPAFAATFSYSGTFGGNECFGQGGFSNCTLSDASTVAKFKYKKGVQVKSVLNDTVFPSIDGGEFQIFLKNKRRGKWTYTPISDDPQNITGFVVKAGKKYAVYTWDTDSGNDFSDIRWNSKKIGKKRMKHLTFFGSDSASGSGSVVSPVPLPAAGFLLVAGLGGLAGLRRRRKH